MKTSHNLEKTFLALFFLLLNNASNADCNNAQIEQGTQSAINECAYSNFQTADLELNIAYKELLTRIQNDQDLKLRNNLKSALKASQQNWLKFRDSQCKLESLPVGGGSMEPTIRNGCLTQLTKQRTETLKNMLLSY